MKTWLRKRLIDWLYPTLTLKQLMDRQLYTAEDFKAAKELAERTGYRRGYDDGCETERPDKVTSGLNSNG
jgi:hypothetical protein